MVNGRAKGANGEREFCKWLKDNLNLEATPKRNLEQTRSGGADVLCLDKYCFEVKRVEKLDLFNAWCQCVETAKELDRTPIVAFRFNHKKWEFLIPACFLDADFNNGYIRLPEYIFLRWLRRHYLDC